MNKTIRTLLEVLGDPQEEGGYKLPLNGEEISVHLNKDHTTHYPEIVLSPFITQKPFVFNRWTDHNFDEYISYRRGICQVDILDKNLATVNKIFQEIKERLCDFFFLEQVIYNYNEYFEEIEPNLYKNISYGLGDLFKDIYYVNLESQPLTRVDDINDLVDNSYYVDTEALYIKTDKCLKTIEINVITQGRLLSNHDSLMNRGLIYYDLSEIRNLSALEDNEVERCSFDIEVTYAVRTNRDEIHDVDYVEYNDIKM